MGLDVEVALGLWVSVKLDVTDADALLVEEAVQDGVAVNEAVTVSVLVFEPVAVALALSVGDHVMLSVALGVSTAAGVCVAETVLLGVGEEKTGERDGAKVGKTNVSRGVGILKKGLSGSLGFVRPDGLLSQNGKAWPKLGKASKKSPKINRTFISRRSATPLRDNAYRIHLKSTKVPTPRRP